MTCNRNCYSDKNIGHEIKQQKAIKQGLDMSLLELTLTKKHLVFLSLSMTYLDILNTRLIN